MKQAICVLLCVGALIGISIGQGEYPQCPPEGTTNLAHPNCSIFIVCIAGRGTEIVCSRGLYYNPTTTLCDFPENVPECIEGTRAPLPPTTLPPTTPVTGEPSGEPTATQDLTTSAATQNPTTSAPATSQTPTESTVVSEGTSAASQKSV